MRMDEGKEEELGSVKDSVSKDVTQHGQHFNPQQDNTVSSRSPNQLRFYEPSQTPTAEEHRANIPTISALSADEISNGNDKGHAITKKEVGHEDRELSPRKQAEPVSIPVKPQSGMGKNNGLTSLKPKNRSITAYQNYLSSTSMNQADRHAASPSTALNTHTSIELEAKTYRNVGSAPQVSEIKEAMGVHTGLPPGYRGPPTGGTADSRQSAADNVSPHTRLIPQTVLDHHHDTDNSSKAQHSNDAGMAIDKDAGQQSLKADLPGNISKPTETLSTDFRASSRASGNVVDNSTLNAETGQQTTKPSSGSALTQPQGQPHSSTELEPPRALPELSRALPEPPRALPEPPRALPEPPRTLPVPLPHQTAAALLTQTLAMSHQTPAYLQAAVANKIAPMNTHVTQTFQEASRSIPVHVAPTDLHVNDKKPVTVPLEQSKSLTNIPRLHNVMSGPYTTAPENLTGTMRHTISPSTMSVPYTTAPESLTGTMRHTISPNTMSMPYTTAPNVLTGTMRHTTSPNTMSGPYTAAPNNSTGTMRHTISPNTMSVPYTTLPNVLTGTMRHTISPNTMSVPYTTVPNSVTGKMRHTTSPNTMSGPYTTVPNSLLVTNAGPYTPALTNMPGPAQYTTVSSSLSGRMPYMMLSKTSVAQSQVTRPDSASQAESDMDTASDSDSRLVVDSDTRTDDGNDDVSMSGDESDSQDTVERVDFSQQTSEMEVHPSDSQAKYTLNHVNVLKTYRPQKMQTKDNSKSVTNIGFQRMPFEYVPAGVSSVKSIPSATCTIDSKMSSNSPTIKLEGTSSRVMIPSVVSDMGSSSDREGMQDHKLSESTTSKKSEFSLPANINYAKLFEPTKIPANLAKINLSLSTEDSLLKVNKPKTAEPLVTRPQVVQELEVMEQSQRYISLPANFEAIQQNRQYQELQGAGWRQVIPPHVREMAIQVKSEVKSPKQQGDSASVKTETPGAARPQALHIPVNFINIKPEQPVTCVSSSDTHTQTASLKSQSSEDTKVNILPTTVSPSVHDGGSSEEQVNHIIKKYNIFGPAEKREVSVKDMRRVIPQLIMCLYSKDDHHARKVKGLWEKKPAQWPDDIPYCDPNNSNRGGEGGGKPKKETLHKMFGFLLDKYIQKGVKDGSLLSNIKPREVQDHLFQSILREPSPSASTPPPRDSTGPASKQPYRPSAGSFQQSTSSLPANVSFNNSKMMLIGSGDLSGLVKPKNPQGLKDPERLIKMVQPIQVPHRSEQRSPAGPALAHPESSTMTLQRSLPYSSYSSSSKLNPEDPVPPPKRQKTAASLSDYKEPRLESNDGLPTVVGMYSPVRDSSDSVRKLVMDTVKSESERVTPEERRTPVSAGLMPLPQQTNTFVSQELLGYTHYLQSRAQPTSAAMPTNISHLPASSLPVNKDLMFSGQTDIPLSMFKDTGLVPSSAVTSSGPVISPSFSSQSDGHMSRPLVSSSNVIPGMSAHSLPINLPKFPIGSPMIHIPANTGFQQMITTKAVSGIPIFMPNKDGQPASFLLPPGLLSTAGVQIPTNPVLSPARLMGPPPIPSSIDFTKIPSSLLSPTAQTDIALKYKHLTDQPPVSISLPPPISSAPVSSGTTRDLLLGLKRQTNSVTQNIPSAELPRSHPSMRSHPESEAASAILLLSNPREINSNVQRTLHSAAPETRTDSSVQSIDSDYQSMEGNRSSVNLSTGLGGSTVQDLSPASSQSGSPSNAINAGASVKFEGKLPQLPQRYTDLTYPMTSLSQANVLQRSSLDSGLYVSNTALPSHTPPSPIPPRRSHRTLSPSSETDSCEEDSSIKVAPPPAVDENKPMSLILHNRPEHPEDETVAIEVSKDESYNPIREVMGRVKDKINRVVQMNKERRFPKKDLSLLMIVHDILLYKQDSLRHKDIVEFILTSHKLEASLDVALSQRLVPESLRAEWRDYNDRNEGLIKKKEIIKQAPPGYHLTMTTSNVLMDVDRVDSFESLDSLSDYRDINIALNILELDLDQCPSKPSQHHSTDTTRAISSIDNADKFDEDLDSQHVNIDDEFADQGIAIDLAVNTTADHTEVASSCRSRVAECLQKSSIQDHNKHTSTGCHNYARKQRKVSRRDIKPKPRVRTSQKRVCDINTDETVIHISKGQNCVELGELGNEKEFAKELKDINVKLKLAICNESFIENFSQLTLTKKDLRDIAVVCFHDPSSAESQYNSNENDDRATEKIIQIVEDLRQSVEAIPNNDVYNTRVQPVNLHRDFTLDDVDVVVVDKDLDMYSTEDGDDQDSLPSITNIENYRSEVSSPVMNTEEADLFGACGSSLLPPFSDMGHVNMMMAAVNTELDHQRHQHSTSHLDPLAECYQTSQQILDSIVYKHL